MRGLEIKIIDYKSPHMQDAFDLRYEVFVLEQNVPCHMEIDEYDKSAIHLVALYCNKIIGVLRGVKYNDYIKIGRVAVNKNYRGLGIGYKMMNEFIKYAYNIKINNIVLDSRTDVVGFYEKLGFKKKGDEFMDANIPHIRMLRKKKK